MANDKFKRNDRLLHSSVGGDVVALDVDRGRCFGLQEAGVRIWEMLEQPVDVAAICDTLMVEYDVDPAVCAVDVEEFIRKAVEEGVVRRV